MNIHFVKCLYYVFVDFWNRFVGLDNHSPEETDGQQRWTIVWTVACICIL
jgi:hypothetical protein